MDSSPCSSATCANKCEPHDLLVSAAPAAQPHAFPAKWAGFFGSCGPVDDDDLDDDLVDDLHEELDADDDDHVDDVDRGQSLDVDTAAATMPLLQSIGELLRSFLSRKVR